MRIERKLDKTTKAVSIKSLNPGECFVLFGSNKATDSREVLEKRSVYMVLNPCGPFSHILAANIESGNLFAVIDDSQNPHWGLPRFICPMYIIGGRVHRIEISATLGRLY